jgi:predicted dehydrogenase
MTDLRVVVVGAGVMGANHARVARHLRHAQLVAVVDGDRSRAEAAALPVGARVYTDLDMALAEESVDLAVVAVPTDAHVDTVEKCFAAGAHVLVEKPIAASVADGARLVSRAADSGRVLAVGHVERFNAAVVELPRLLDDPIHVCATRISPYSPRVTDGVIQDLMIHDIDIVLSLAGPDASLASVSGIARSTRGPTDDLAVANVMFDTGFTATFITSRIAQQKVRTIEITQRDSFVVADLVRQDVTVHRMSRHEYLSDDGVRYRQSSVVEVPFLDQRGEPLARELQDVVDAIVERRPPLVGGAEGIRAVGVADRIARSVRRESEQR